MTMTHAWVRAPRPVRVAGEEQAARMIRAASELLAIDSTDARARARYREVALRLDHALRSRNPDPRAILAASPTVRDQAGTPRPMVALVAALEDDLEAGVRSAITLFQVSDWSPAR